MSRTSIEDQPKSPRVIVVERRSLMSQIGGAWLVALPLAIAYVICRTPLDVPETPASQLRLGPADWFVVRDSEPKDAAKAKGQRAPEQIGRLVEPKPAVVVAAESTSGTQANPEKSTTPDPGPELPQGVTVLDTPRTSVNPVAVFDPEGKAPQAVAEPENQTAKAALNFEGGAPTNDETRQALEEIQKASEIARAERERNETLKPLVAVHEQAQADRREAQRRDVQRRRAVESREAFIDGLNAVLGSDGTITEKGRKIDLLIRRDAENSDFAAFQNLFQRIEASKRPMSRAARIRSLRSSGVPESMILSYLIELDKKDIRKASGPRDNDDAIVRSAALLLKSMQ